ncbi:hypothetical protein IX51_00685 [uncultured archaeon]|nr:hypothetical protein IX51_00685 [uncultured archaeon]
MESTLFIRIVETEYRSMISEANGQWRSNPGQVESYVMNIPEETVSRFKEWFKYALGATDIWIGDRPVRPEDVIAYAASRRSQLPPFKPLYPDIIKILKLYTEEELMEIFGPSLGEYLTRESEAM